MKITFVLLFASLMQVSAAVFSQKITYTQKQTSVKEVFNQIYKQTGYNIFWSPKLIKNSRKFDVNFKESSISEVLEICLNKLPLTYTIDDKTIVIKEKEENSLKVQDIQKDISIKGKVIDSKGLPLPGASIKLKGSTTGTVTNVNGQFTLNVPSESSILVFSFLGFISQEVVVGNQNQLSIVLKEDLSNLNEVVVVGYGTTKKVDLTGAITTLKGEKLNISPLASTQNTLVGQIPGLVSRQTSGEPGKDAASLSIRGFGTALIIVDGVERQFNDIDPNSIETVTVLKDASAAIFGARAGNGVILITTKRGNIGKPELQFNNSYTLQGFTSFSKPYSAGQFSEMWLEAQKNDKVPQSSWRFTEDQVQKYYAGTDPKYPNTNWFDFAVRDWSPQQQHNLSMRGGNEKIKYYGMMGTVQQEGFIKTGDNKYTRYNVVSNIDANITDNLSGSINMSIINSNLVAPVRSYDSGSDGRNIFFQDLFVVEPILPTSYPDPTKIPISNIPFSPTASENIDISGYRKNRISETNMSGALEYKMPFIKGLKARAFGNYLQRNLKNKTFTKQYTAYQYDYDNDIYTPVNSGLPTSLLQGSSDNSTLTGQFSFQYENTFGKHNISALALYEIIDQVGEGISGSRTNYLTSSIDYLFAGGTTNQMITGDANEFGRVSYVSRINYNYAQKYLLQVTTRYDASPKFAPEHRWGFFPSVSAGWRISEEPFLKSKKVLDDLKFRASYSQTGFDATGNFQYLSGYQLGTPVLFGGTSVPGLSTTGLANPNISWEQMTTYNSGLDFAFFNRKLYGELDVFYRKREGILATRIASLPNTFGASLPAENLNGQSNRGFELMLGTNGKTGEFRYNVEGNISWTRAKWDNLDEPNYTDPDEIRILKQTGQWVGRQFGFKSDGLFTSQEEINAYPLNQDNRRNITIRPGDIKYVDISGPDGTPDGKLDWRDQVVMGGAVVPQVFFGLSSTLKYKTFDINFLLQGATLSTLRVSPSRYTSAIGTNEAYIGRWTPKNNDANANFPLRSFNQANNNQNSDFWIVDGSYVRLKVVSLGYTLPKQILRKSGIDKVRFSVSGTNLFTIDKATKLGIDPETPNGGAGFYYPAQRTISMGLNLTF